MILMSQPELSAQLKGHFLLVCTSLLKGIEAVRVSSDHIVTSRKNLILFLCGESSMQGCQAHFETINC